jgi:flagellar basal body-associated protein FliL
MEQNAGLTVALILVALAVLMQAGVTIAIWLAVRKVPGQVEAFRADVKQRFDPLAQSITEIVSNAREPLRAITTNLAEISFDNCELPVGLTHSSLAKIPPRSA